MRQTFSTMKSNFGRGMASARDWAASKAEKYPNAALATAGASVIPGLAASTWLMGAMGGWGMGALGAGAGAFLGGGRHGRRLAAAGLNAAAPGMLRGVGEFGARGAARSLVTRTGRIGGGAAGMVAGGIIGGISSWMWD